MGSAITIPRILGIGWWWLVAAFVVDAFLAACFPWYGRVPLGITGAWTLVQMLWLKRAEPESHAVYWYVAFAVLSFVLGITGRWNDSASFGNLVLFLAEFALCLTAIFTFRADMEHYFSEIDPVGLKLIRL